MARDRKRGVIGPDESFLSAQETLCLALIGGVIYALSEKDTSGQSGEPGQQVSVVSESVLVRHSLFAPIVAAKERADSAGDCTTAKQCAQSSLD